MKRGKEFLGRKMFFQKRVSRKRSHKKEGS